jgi:hypothetical protein
MAPEVAEAAASGIRLTLYQLKITIEVRLQTDAAPTRTLAVS